MNPDDRRTLGDYLDGQLDVDRQHAIESALVSDAQLADALRDLVVVRDLVSSMPRDYRVNVTARVLRRIEARRWIERRSMARLSGWFRTPPRMRLAGGLAFAVLLLAVVPFLWPRPLPERVPTQAVQVVRKSKGVIATPPQTDLIVAKDKGLPAQALAVQPSAPTIPVKSSSLSSGRAEVAIEIAQAMPRTMEQLTTLLDNKNLRQIFVVSNQKDGRASQRVASLVEQTTRFDYFAITIAQGVVIDPLHPEEATVFAMVVNPAELDHLRKQLKSSLQDDVEECSANAELVTQLADIGQVKSCKPAARGQVTIPRSEMAFRAKLANPIAGESESGLKEQAANLVHSESASAGSVASTRRRDTQGSGVEVGRAASIVSLTEARLPATPAEHPAEADESVVVLIWVRGTARARHGRGRRFTGI